MNFILFLCFFILFFIYIFYKKKNKLYIDETKNNKTNTNDEFIVPNIEQNSHIKEIKELKKVLKSFNESRQNLDSKYNPNVCRDKNGRYKSLKK